MEKRKPTIDEIYKLNVDGLFESTANWFDNAFKKSQAEINRDLYNKINGYSSSSESTGGNVNLGPLLTSLNGSNLYPSRGYLYYNGNDWEFNTPTISGGEGGVVDTAAITKIVNDTIKNVSWWGQKINNNKVDGNIVITKGSHSFTIELDDNGNLKFNGNIYATGGITALGVGTTTGGGSGVSLGTLLTKLNSDNPFPTDNGQVLTYDGSNFIWKIPTGSGGSSSSFRYPLTIYNGSSNTNYITYDGSSSAYLKFKSGFSISKVGSGYEISVSCGGSGSSSTTAGKLYFSKNTDSDREAYWNGESNFRIIFGSGLNVSWDSNTQITLSATGGSGGSSTGGSVDLSSYLTKTEASTTYAAKSHNHSINDIISFTDNVKAIKVNNALKADKLNNSVYLWGNSFDGSSSIGTSNTYADLQYVKNIYTGNKFDIYSVNNNEGYSVLGVNETLNISVAYGYRSNENAILSLFGNKTKIYTNGQNYHFDFVKNIFDVNSNQIHFGSETNGGKIYWDAANNAFKIEGNVYATGNITAFGVGTTNDGESGVILSPVMTAINNQLGNTTSNTPQFLYWDGSKYTWKNESEISGGSGSIQVAKEANQGESESWVSATKLRFVGITGTKPTITTNSNKGCVDVGIPTGGGSGSSSRINKIKLFNSGGSSFETIDLGTADTIGFMAGNNVSLEALFKEYTNVIKISATGSSGGSGGSTSTSVSWENVTNKPSAFTPSSHTHSTSDINGLSNYVQGVTVNNATNADRATQLANSRTIWGQRFNGTSDINGNLSLGTAGGGSIQLRMNDGNMLNRTNNALHIGYGLKESSNGEIDLDAYVTKVYTDNMSKHYDFKSNVFDVNSNQIHFGSETNGGTLSWDSENKCFKIDGSVYATGGITALGVSNNATTSNNVDSTFRSVTIPGNRQNKVQLTDEGLVFYNHDVTIAYYKNNSIGLYDSVNDACCKIFGFADSMLTFDPGNYAYNIVFNNGLSCYTDENTLNVGSNGNIGYIHFYSGSTMTFNHNNKNYSFNVDKAIEQGILTI